MSTTPEVEAKVHIVPAKRTATYSVPLSDREGDELGGEVKASAIRILGHPESYSSGREVVTLPKSHEALASLEALVSSLHHELDEQGVEEGVKQ